MLFMVVFERKPPHLSFSFNFFSYFCTMKSYHFFHSFSCGAVLFVASLMHLSCTTHRHILTSVQRSRIVVDDRFDRTPDARALAFLAPYKHQVDSVMSPVMGTVAHDMEPRRPESDLSNLLSDILVWAAKDYGEQPDLGVYNIGGIRAALTRGQVTYGDVLAVAPFENKIAFITLTGTQLLELFAQIAHRGGEGVSHGVQLVISASGQLLSARLHGKAIDPQAHYRVTTIDYLLGGNDGLTALSQGTQVVSPQEERNNSRFIIMDYFRSLHRQGKSVDAQVEGRIVLVSDSVAHR